MTDEELVAVKYRQLRIACGLEPLKRGTAWPSTPMRRRVRSRRRLDAMSTVRAFELEALFAEVDAEA